MVNELMLVLTAARCCCTGQEQAGSPDEAVHAVCIPALLCLIYSERVLCLSNFHNSWDGDG